MADLGRLFQSLARGARTGLGTYLDLSEQERQAEERETAKREAATAKERKEQNERTMAQLLFENRPDVFGSPADALAAVQSGANIGALAPREDDTPLAVPTEFVDALQRGDRDTMIALYAQAPPDVQNKMVGLMQGTGQAGPPREERGPQISPAELRQQNRERAGGAVSELLLGALPTFGQKPEGFELLTPEQRRNAERQGAYVPSSFDPDRFRQTYNERMQAFDDPSAFHSAFFEGIGRLPDDQRRQILEAIARRDEAAMPTPPVPGQGLGPLFQMPPASLWRGGGGGR